jgi:hypothetical protein
MTSNYAKYVISLAVVFMTLLLFITSPWPGLKPVYAQLSDQSTIKLLASSSEPSAFFIPPSSSSSNSQSNSTNATTGAPTEVKFLPYENSTYGIRIQYPSSWLKEESHNQSSNDIVKFSSTARTAPASLAITGGKPAPQSIPLQLYINASIDVLKHSFDNFSLVESNATTLAGFPAYKIVYTGIIPSSGLELKFMQILTIKDSKNFVITFGTLPTDFSTYVPTIQKMIDSFAFIPVTTPAANTTTPAANATAPATNATAPATNATAPAASFNSAFDTFVVPGSVNGYGVYQAHNSSIFKPGERILLYIEPAGYSYKPMGSLFLMNFTADVLVSDKAGHVLTGLQNLPISTIISHYKNKELLLTVSLTQTNPFPTGDYVLKYTIHDVPSGNSFDIVKNIRIA